MAKKIKITADSRFSCAAVISNGDQFECSGVGATTLKKTAASALAVPEAKSLFAKYNESEQVEVIRRIMTAQDFNWWFRDQFLVNKLAIKAILQAKKTRTVESNEQPRVAENLLGMITAFGKCTRIKQYRILKHILTPNLVCGWFFSLGTGQRRTVLEIALMGISREQEIERRSVEASDARRRQPLPSTQVDQPTASRWMKFRLPQPDAHLRLVGAEQEVTDGQQG